MICKNCGAQLEEGSKFCAECGTKVDDVQVVAESNGAIENPVVQEPINPIVNNQSFEQVNPNFGSVDNAGMSSYDNGSSDEKPKKNFLLPVILLLVLAVLVGGGYYYFTSKGRVIKNLINNAYEKFDSLTFSKEYDFENQSVLISGDLSINTNIPELQDLNSSKLNYVFGMDYANKKLELGTSLEEDGLKLFDVVMYFLDNNSYISFKDDFDKLIKFEDVFLDDVFTTSDGTNLSEEDAKYVAKAYKEILINSLDSKDFVKSTATITLNGKDTKVTKLTYDMTSAKVAKLVNNVIDGTLNDSKLLEILAKETDSSIDSVKSLLSSSKISDTTSGGEKITFDIYTKGFNNSFVGMDIQGIIQIRKNSDNVTIEAGLGSERVSFVIKKLSDDSCVIELNSNIGGEVIKGSLSVTSKEVEKNVYEGTVIFDLSYDGITFNVSNKFNEKIGASIADIDVSNAVGFESLSQDDLNKVEENLGSKFQNSKLYKLIENLSFSSNSYYGDYDFDDYDFEF